MTVIAVPQSKRPGPLYIGDKKSRRPVITREGLEFLECTRGSLEKIVLDDLYSPVPCTSTVTFNGSSKGLTPLVTVEETIGFVH